MSDTEVNIRELEETVSELPTRFFDCRLADHRWKRQGEPLHEGNGLYVFLWRCTCCKAERYDRATLAGTLYARWYRRPKGYDIKGFGQATRRKDTYRRLMIAQLDDEENES